MLAIVCLGVRLCAVYLEFIGFEYIWVYYWQPAVISVFGLSGSPPSCYFLFYICFLNLYCTLANKYDDDDLSLLAFTNAPTSLEPNLTAVYRAFTCSRIASAWWVLQRLLRPRHPRLDSAQNARVFPSRPTQTIDSISASHVFRSLFSTATPLAAATPLPANVTSRLSLPLTTCTSVPLLGNLSSGSQCVASVPFMTSGLPKTANSGIRGTIDNHWASVNTVASQLLDHGCGKAFRPTYDSPALPSISSAGRWRRIYLVDRDSST